MTILHVGVGLVSLAVLTGALVLASGRSGPTGVAKSLALIEHSVDQRSVTRSELPVRERLLTPLLDKTRGLAVALSPTGTSDRLARMLDRAGNPPVWTVDRVLGAKGTALIVGLVLGLLYGGGFALRGLFLAAAVGAALFFLPDILVYNAGLRRQEQMGRSLAEALDMLTVCVEAGQGFDAALMQVARNVEGPVAGEFARALSEIQIGKSRGEAFAAMGERVSLPEVKNFVTALVQADRLGLPIAGVLREQTATMRLTRKQKAEERAQKVTVKILFPLMFCIFPVLFIVVIGPAAIRLIDTFSRL
jgi:tight adherence protein C